MTRHRKYDRAVRQDSVEEYRTVRDQSATMPDIFNPSGRLQSFLALRKITIVSNAAMHTPRPQRVIFDRDEVSSKSHHVGCAPESRSKIRVLASVMTEPWRVDDAARRVIQAPKLEPSNHALRTHRL